MQWVEEIGGGSSTVGERFIVAELTAGVVPHPEGSLKLENQ